MIPGETIESGAPKKCEECGVSLELMVLRSAAGYYIGSRCNCGPYSRESDYYTERKKAEHDLEHGTWVKR